MTPLLVLDGTSDWGDELLLALVSAHADWLRAFDRAKAQNVRQPELGQIPEFAKYEAAWERARAALSPRPLETMADAKPFPFPGVLQKAYEQMLSGDPITPSSPPSDAESSNTVGAARHPRGEQS